MNSLFKLFLTALVVILPALSFGQVVKGKVTDDLSVPLHGATIQAYGTSKNVLTAVDGSFEIELSKKSRNTIVVSYVGFRADTVGIADSNFLSIKLLPTSSIADVTVESRRRASYISNLPIKTEVITSLELKKAACCDLSGCFETQASVHPQTTNILTNSKELRILGLSGIYNQVLIDGFPQIQGLSYTYGISSLPGTLVENIWVAKGANSVLQGYESISGQINVITKEPGKTDKLLLNGYVNSFGEKHANVNYGFAAGKWSNLTALHTVQPAGRVDKDEDRFLDLPLLTRYMIVSKWKKGDETKWGWSSQIGMKYLSERRIGGESNFNYDADKGTSNAYGHAVKINQPDLWYKMAYRMNDEHRFAFYASGFHQDQESYFGVTTYKAKQTNGYTNLQYERNYNNNGSIKTGFSLRYQNLIEDIAFSSNALGRTYAGRYKKMETVPGIFAENSIQTSDQKLTWMVGIRADHHNEFDWKLTPRTLVKYLITPSLTARASIGTGFRTANIFSENIGLLVSSRDIVFEERLLPEEAVNYGFNLTQKLVKGKSDAYISADFYRTSFQNQIFPDYDSDPNKAIIKNFTGQSASNGFQFEAGGSFFDRIAAKVGYVFLDVYQIKGEIKETLPFNPKHRVNGSLSYMPASKKWHVDANAHWYGRQELPNTTTNPVQYQMPSVSDPYAVANLQFTYKLKKFEFYTGVENILNFRQDKPIISWQYPFGKYFDTQFAWGPTRGREAYVGFRYIIK